MKKIIFTVLGIIVLGIPFIPTTQASSWTSVKDRYARYFSTRYKTTTPTANTTSNTGYRSPYRDYYSRNSNVARTQRRYPTRSTSKSYDSRRLSSLSLNIRSTLQNKAIFDINAIPIKVFKVGVFNQTPSSSRYLTEALLLRKVSFQMISNSGIASDPTRFDLVMNDENFQFNKDGTVTLDFLNARVATGENFSFDIAIKVHDPIHTPQINGSLKLRVLGAEAVKESSGTEVSARLSGHPLSSFLTFNPVPTTSGTSSFSARTYNIYGKTLSAGEKAYALALNFEAYYDDMIIEGITVRDTLSNGGVNSFIKAIEAIDGSTGKVLQSARFTNGSAHLRFFQGIEINRGGEQKQIIFRVHVADRINSSNSKFKLEVAPSDVYVRGRASGGEVPVANKNFRVDSETFSVVQSGGSMRVFHSPVQPDGFAAIPMHNQVYRFKVYNPGDGEISLGRVSLDVFLEGVDFYGGKSADDFVLRHIKNNQEITSTAFRSTLGIGNAVIFDADSEIYIESNSEMEFALKLKLDDIAGQGDSIAVKILGDYTLTEGTLGSVRSSNANFIWSDHSGRPHTSTSDDWRSGYLVNGLPTGLSVNKR